MGRIIDQPNIDYMMDMTREYLSGRIDGMSYVLDFQYEMEKRYHEMYKEDDDYCWMISEYLYKDAVCSFDEYSDTEFKKFVRRQYNYIKRIAREGFY